jgi:hypothetical protein
MYYDLCRVRADCCSGPTGSPIRAMKPEPRDLNWQLKWRCLIPALTDSLAAFKRTLKVFADLVLRGKIPVD